MPKNSSLIPPLVIQDFMMCLEEAFNKQNSNSTFYYEEWLYLVASFFNASSDTNNYDDGSNHTNISTTLRDNVDYKSMIEGCMIKHIETERPYLLAWWKQLLWCTVFSIILVISIVGNTIVMWIILGKFFAFKCNHF